MPRRYKPRRKPGPWTFSEIVDNCDFDENDCLVWKWPFVSSGPQARVNGKVVQVARLSFELYHETHIAPHLHAVHSCHNPACVNPDHLFLATHEDAMTFNGSKKRVNVGEAHGMAKLTEPEVQEIRHRLEDGEKARDIVPDYDLRGNIAVNLIEKRETWGWLNEDMDMNAFLGLAA